MFDTFDISFLTAVFLLIIFYQWIRHQNTKRELQRLAEKQGNQAKELEKERAYHRAIYALCGKLTPEELSQLLKSCQEEQKKMARILDTIDKCQTSGDELFYSVRLIRRGLQELEEELRYRQTDDMIENIKKFENPCC